MMRKKIIVILTAGLLATSCHLQNFMPVGLSGIYESEAESIDDSLMSQAENTAGSEAEEETVTNDEEPTVPDEETTAEEAGEGDPEPEPVEETEEEAGAGMPSNAEEDTLDGAITGFTALSSHEAIVVNYSELRSALADDNGITTVYFGDSITMQNGIKINPQKHNVVISGLNPLDPAQKQPYTLTDLNSATFTDTVYIDEVGTKSLHIMDLTMIGKNYYSPFSIADLASLADVSLTYERVNYDGPQLVHHRRGTVHFIDCTATIHGGNGLSISSEFSEAKHLVFEGVNTIDTATSTLSVFWLPAGGSFQIADDSTLLLTSPNTSSTYGVFSAGGPSYKVDLTIGNRAVFRATIAGVVAPYLYSTLNSFTVREGGEFYLAATITPAAPVLQMGGALTVEKDAKFILSALGNSSVYPILRQEQGDITVGKDAIFHITAANANISLLALYGRAFLCNDPASILLYNANRDIHALTSAGRVYVNAQQVNYWNTLSAGGLDAPPLYGWRKADKSNFLIDGTLAIGTGGNFSSLSSNYSPGDPPGSPPNATTFSMVNARVLAFGRLELLVAEPTTSSTGIRGITAPGATVRVSFTQQGIGYTFPDVAADMEGVFHIPLDVTLQESTVILVQSSWQYLTAAAEVTVSREGQLEFYVPDILEFYTTQLSPFTKTVTRLQPDWKIAVSDARGKGSEWSIYARLDKEMTPNPENRPVLDGALVYVDALGNTKILGTDADIFILGHTSTNDEEIFPIVWEDDKGILLTVKPGTAFADTVYTATISWTLVDGV